MGTNPFGIESAIVSEEVQDLGGGETLTTTVFADGSIMTRRHIEYKEPECIHQFEERMEPPTCCAEGYTVHSCTKCSYAFIDNYVPADPDAHDLYQSAYWELPAGSIALDSDGNVIGGEGFVMEKYIRCRNCEYHHIYEVEASTKDWGWLIVYDHDHIIDAVDRMGQPIKSPDPDYTYVVWTDTYGEVCDLLYTFAPGGTYIACKLDASGYSPYGCWNYDPKSYGCMTFDAGTDWWTLNYGNYPDNTVYIVDEIKDYISYEKDKHTA